MQLRLIDSQTQRGPKRHGNSLTIEREVAWTAADTVLEFGSRRAPSYMPPCRLLHSFYAVRSPEA